MVAVLLIAMFALAGCPAGEPVTGEKESAVSADRNAELNLRLESLPNLEQVTVQYVALTSRIAAAVTEVVPELIWEEGQRVGKMSCPGELAGSEGFVISTTMLVSDVPIPSDKWAPALVAAQTIAAEGGLAKLTVRQDQPDNHDVMLNGADGASLTFGSRKAALISMTTPCRLEDRRDS